jgi:hypothetical protein
MDQKSGLLLMGVAGKPRMLDLEWKLRNEDWKMRGVVGKPEMLDL